MKGTEILSEAINLGGEILPCLMLKRFVYQ